MKDITIDPELKLLLPPLSDEEYAGLEASIRKDGCLSPLVEWNGTLIDGHHRYEICTKHGIPFDTKSIEFDGIDDAKLWILEHQKNRRNLTSFQRCEIALKFKEIVAAKAKERQGRRNDLCKDNIPENLPGCNETRQELAEYAGVSSRTFDKCASIIENADEETKEKLRRGDKGISIDKAYKQVKSRQNDSKLDKVSSAKTIKNEQSDEGVVFDGETDKAAQSTFESVSILPEVIDDVPVVEMEQSKDLDYCVQELLKCLDTNKDLDLPMLCLSLFQDCFELMGVDNQMKFVSKFSVFLQGKGYGGDASIDAAADADA